MGGTTAAAAALKCAEARDGDCGRAEAARCGEQRAGSMASGTVSRWLLVEMAGDHKCLTPTVWT